MKPLFSSCPWWTCSQGPKSTDHYIWSKIKSTHTLAQHWVESSLSLEPSHTIPHLNLEKWIWLQSYQQSSGIGQHGKSFFSPLGGLYVTLMSFWPPLKYTSTLSLLSAWAIAEVLGPECRLKWVNDIFWGHKKIAGILIHRHGIGTFSPYIISFGININTMAQYTPLQRSISSLYLETGKTWDIALIFNHIKKNFFYSFQDIITRNGALSDMAVAGINRRLMAHGQIVRLNGDIVGRCCGINAYGRIILDSGKDYDVFSLGIEGQIDV